MVGCSCCVNTGKDIRISFCPKCESRKVGYVFGLGNLFGVIPKMKCRDCGFSAGVFPVLVSSERELKRAVEGMKVKKKVVKRKTVKKRKKTVRKTIKKKVIRRKK